MTSDLCKSRLRKEYKQLITNPVENIKASPKESNILEWHYVIEGAKGTDYEGGHYHGILTFPKEYPYKPPSIQMLTPNGRFKVSTRLCLSMSDFHPETWNPMWSVGTILMGLYSFMQEETPTHGSMTATLAYRRKAATDSLAYNCQNKIFCELFPELVELHEKRQKEIEENNHISKTLSSQSSSSDTDVENSRHMIRQGGGQVGNGQFMVIPHIGVWSTIIGVILAIVACIYAIINLSI